VSEQSGQLLLEVSLRRDAVEHVLDWKLFSLSRCIRFRLIVKLRSDRVLLEAKMATEVASLCPSPREFRIPSVSFGHKKHFACKPDASARK
jgi:hypothetical protein